MEKPSDLPISDADWHDTPTLQMLVVKLWQRLQQLEQRVTELEQRQQGGGKESSSKTALEGAVIHRLIRLNGHSSQRHPR